MPHSTRPPVPLPGRVRVIGRSDLPRPHPGRLVCLLPLRPAADQPVAGRSLAIAATADGRGYRVLTVLEGGRRPTPPDGPRPPCAARIAVPRAA